MATEQPLVHGFMIGGYRSFRYEPQKIFPLGKMTLVAGSNNSGKSNVLLAAQTWLSAIRAGKSAAVNLGPLDYPQLDDDAAVQRSRPTIGIALKMSASDAAQYLRDNFTASSTSSRPLVRRPPVGSYLESLLSVGGFRDASDSSFMWLQWEWTGSELVRSASQLETIEKALQPAGLEASLNDVTERLFQRSQDTRGNIQMILDALRKAVEVPDVITIPAIREIQHDASLAHDIWELSGRGLPRIIQTWQAPSADRHRENRRKYTRMNEFLKDVLEDETAEIGAPFDAATVHISLKDQTLPLENLGTGLAQVALIAAVAIDRSKSLVCIEEPELHLHPTLLRKLLTYLRHHTDNQYLISTHSAQLLDRPEMTIFRTSYAVSSGTTVERAGTPTERAKVARHLGYRPSDLIQANAVVWVEGPSDRIYLNHWIRAVDDRLFEGVHYSIMFYGGALIAHLKGDDLESFEPYESDFVSLLRINRNMIMMIDSDKASEDAPLRETKAGLTEEFSENGGLAWITRGREIENYVPTSVFVSAAKQVHSRSTVIDDERTDDFEDLFQRIKIRGTADKVRIAEAAIKAAPHQVWDVLDLRERIAEVVNYIQNANGLSSS